MTNNEKLMLQLAGKLRKRVLELNNDGARLNGIGKQGSASAIWKAAEMLRMVIVDLEI